jgi:cytochrome c-type biogenesis protein CcmH
MITLGAIHRQLPRLIAAALLALLLPHMAPALVVPAYAISDPAEALPDPAQEARAERIGRQLRCLVCQNESIEDSGADLARDLRKIVRQQVAAGASDQQVIAWLVARYGNFVRLRPPFNALTALLWASPVVALLLGFGLALAGRRQRAAAAMPLSEAERVRLRGLLEP